MRKINSLSDLLMEELAELLDGENQLVDVLPKMVDASQSPALKAALKHHLEITKDQVGRLKDILSDIGQNSQRVTCKAIKGFINEGQYVMKVIEECPARDTAIISVQQQSVKYEITGYKRACEHAADLGHTRIVELLSKTINEVRTMSFHLNELSQFMINVQAIDPSGSYNRKVWQRRYPDEKNDPS